MHHEEPLPTIKQILVSLPVRLVVYGVIIGGVFEVVYQLLQRYSASWLSSEQGPLELAQVGCLLGATIAIAIAVKWSPVGRAALVAAGALSLYGAARESDYWFESLLFEDAYKTLVGLPVALFVIAVVYAERERVVRETLRVSRYPGAIMFMVAGILLGIFCQALDRPHFWPSHGLNDTWGLSKTIVEESAELFAYLLIAFSGLEAMISAKEDQALEAKGDQHGKQPKGPVVEACDAPRRAAA